MPARKPAPPRKTTRTAVRPDRSPEPSLVRTLARNAGRAGGSVLALGGRTLAARPVLFGSIALFAILAGSVADNAFNRQAGRHLHPMLSTRADPGAAPRAVLRAARTEPATEEPRIRNDPRILAFPLVEEVQALLAEKGYYKAVVDGRAGQATDIAIREFQRDRGLRVDGMATPLLLTQLRQGTEPDQIATEIASLDGAIDPGATGATDGGGDRDLVRAIQERLGALKVAQVTADGILGEQTRAAIRTFQALEGMEVTGEPSSAVLDRLAASGR